MPILPADIQLRLSGGAANAVPDASLGGEKSSTAITTATLHNLFDLLSSADAAAGDTEYRCLYVHNAHASLALEVANIWINTQTPSPSTSVEIAVGSSALNAVEQNVAGENAAPTGVTFSAPASEAAGLALGTIPAGQHRAVWVKRIVTAGAEAINVDNVILRVKGDTAA